jgi:hypothetical protein
MFETFDVLRKGDSSRDSDQVVSFDTFLNNDVLVLCKNRLYLVDLGYGGTRISKEALIGYVSANMCVCCCPCFDICECGRTRQFAAIQASAATQPAAVPVGALTGAHRDFWAEVCHNKLWS